VKIEDELVDPIKKAWHLFIERTEPLRPDLFRYCRSLTGSVWDGEDLVQDTLMRAFARLSEATHPIENARAYLFRIASNLWIDKFRGTREIASAQVPEPPQPDIPAPIEIREAAEHLVIHLPPIEGAVVLLKDVFDLSLQETATMLDSTVGAVKAALHRARAKLNELREEPLRPHLGQARVGAALLESFVDAFNARDVNRLTAMMREDATSEMVGMGIEYGRAAIERKSEKSTLYVTFVLSAGNWRVERCDYQGEPILLGWVKEAGGEEIVDDVVRLEERDGSIVRLRYYYFCPEVLTAIGTELGVPVKTNGYRYELN
jgi:RNA polymerase sigma-70 factor (ECF subfamily)